jgi:ppGpp synthetase/RelA/SpoT-type nucleotidyltranferase
VVVEMPPAPFPYSKARVKRAGETVRTYLSPGQPDPPGAELVEALEVVTAFRAAHQVPLTKATMGLRSMVATEGCQLEVSQRLKRFGTILNKLWRHQGMDLARMQDIGGCRAVLDSIDEVYRVQRRIRRNGREKRYVDYIVDPAESGYRGVHSIVEYDGRSIEVQLRTQVQHHWALTVERLGGRLDVDLKSGYGPSEVLGLLEAISRAMAIEEQGEKPPEQLMDEITTLRTAAAHWLQ